MRDKLTTLGELAGIILTSVGFAMFSPALGVIAAGLGVFAASFAAGADR